MIFGYFLVIIYGFFLRGNCVNILYELWKLKLNCFYEIQKKSIRKGLRIEVKYEKVKEVFHLKDSKCDNRIMIKDISSIQKSFKIIFWKTFMFHLFYCKWQMKYQHIWISKKENILWMYQIINELYHTLFLYIESPFYLNLAYHYSYSLL